MSRIGKYPVTIPSGVEVQLAGQMLTAKGRLGALSLMLSNDVTTSIVDGTVTVAPKNDTKHSRAMWGTTRALINYYFGSKEKLYIAVLEQVYAEIREAEAKLDLDHLEPVAAIRRIVEFTYRYYLDHEGFVRLVVAENQARGRQLRKSKAMRTLNRPIIDRLAGVIARGQAAGRFRRDVDPVEIHKAIAALGMFNVTNRYTFGAIFQREMGAKGDVARRRDIVADMIVSYLTKEEQ